MTGIKVKVRRNGDWTEVDADEVVPEEWPAIIQREKRFGGDGWVMVQQLAAWIRQRLSEGR